MKNQITAVLLGALALFVWNFISWVALGLHNGGYKDLPEAVIQSPDWGASLPEAGVYHYPGASLENWQEIMRQGPVVELMVYSPGGREPFSGGDFAKSVLFNLLSALLAVFFLSQSCLESYGSRFIFVALLGLFAGFFVELPFASWYRIPATFFLPNMVDHLVGMTLVGLIAAYFVKPQTTRP